MKKLVILRGIAGSGKSTFVKEHHLENYTICPDELRLLYGGQELSVNGSCQISQEKNANVFSLLMKILEERMKDGAFTVIDATNLMTDDFVKYKKLAKKYRYRLYCIDFSDIDFNTICERNKNREEHKVLPQYVLDKMKNRLETSTIPNGITVLNPSQFDELLIHPIDLSKYNRIHHFGDIHGCYTVLKKYFDMIGGIKNDEYYIFCGDYCDRGIENAETLKFLFDLKDLPNVQFIQGNHEQHLLNYIHNEKIASPEFLNNTIKDLETNGVTKKEISKFCMKLSQCAYYTYNDKIVIATHGGLSTIPNNLIFVPTKQMIKGVGKYQDYTEVAKSFYETTASNVYQVNGHRNVLQLPIEIEDDNRKLRCFNLEGGVEQGGNLRILTLDKNGFKPIYLKNDVYKKQTNQLLFNMQHNSLIKEKRFNEISSFNFTRDAFNKKIWNNQTVKARGLYLNNETGDIVCRGYEKFFAVDEHQESSIGFIKNNYTYPLTCYLKENGYLGLVSYREKTDELFITTKSDPTGIYADWFKQLLNKYDLEKLKKYIKENNCTFAFEVIDIKNDPHIIEYKESKIVLLDIIENTVDFTKKSYEDLCEIAKNFDFEVKKKTFILNSFDEFLTWYKKVSSNNYQYNNEYIEGFVIEDMNKHMCKIKTEYYKRWKYLRGKVSTILAHNLDYEQIKCNVNILSYEKMNLFLKWFCANKQDIKTDKIIEIRKLWQKKF